jgi:ATP-dependent DNA helicase RecG
MPEQQNIEYKSSWHDDYLQWICGFANAQGGRIYIGKNDAEQVVDVENPQQNKKSVGHYCRSQSCAGRW